jgi:hypothetical protein
MNDWTSGYVADIGYTYGYYPELNPLRVKLAFLDAGLVFPEFGNACELGFGQGLSTNVHATASTCNWIGTDFNPAQASFAQELANVSGVGTRIYDEAFSDFASRDDLPMFDYIGLHGIWSWISDENRSVIVDFIRRKLNVGGVLYISYNTLPGWGTFAPMRHLMTEHAEIIGADGAGIVSRINGALDFTQKLLAVNPIFARANPLIGERINKIKDQNRHYLAHEYFNRDWHPMHFATMAEWLEPAKVQYACSATYSDHVDVLNLTADQQKFLAEIPDQMFRESVRDFMVNQQFRKDYWVKGARTISALDKALLLREQKIVLTQFREDVPLKITGIVGEVTLQEAVYTPLLDLMGDYKIRSLAQIEQALKDKLTFAQINQAVIILLGTGAFSPVQDEGVVTKAKKQTDKLNHYILQKAKGSNDISYLASPVSGGGYPLNRFQQLFLGSILSNSSKKQIDNPKQWAEDAWKVLVMVGQKITKEGKTLETAEENINELTEQAETFAKKVLPIVKVLQII